MDVNDDCRQQLYQTMQTKRTQEEIWLGKVFVGLEEATLNPSWRLERCLLSHHELVTINHDGVAVTYCAKDGKPLADYIIILCLNSRDQLFFFFHEFSQKKNEIARWDPPTAVSSAAQEQREICSTIQCKIRY